MAGIDDELSAAWAKSLAYEPSLRRYSLYAIRVYGSFLDRERISLSHATAADVRRFASRMAAEHSPSVASSIVHYVKRFYRWAEELGVCRDVAKGVETVKVPPYSRRAISADEALEILSHIDDVRDKAILSLMIRCDLKSRDIIAASADGVLLFDGAGEIRLSGGSWMPLTRACAEDLSTHVSFEGIEIGAAARLFTSKSGKNRGACMLPRGVRRLVQRAFRAAGMPYSAGDYCTGSAAVELAMMEGEPCDVIVSLCDRTYLYRRH